MELKLKTAFCSKLSLITKQLDCVCIEFQRPFTAVSKGTTYRRAENESYYCLIIYMSAANHRRGNDPDVCLSHSYCILVHTKA